MGDQDNASAVEQPRGTSQDEGHVEPPENLISATAVDEPPPPSWREAMVVVLLVALCDLTIYRGHGFAGYALLFLALPVMLAFGSPRPRLGWSCWIVGAMLVFLAAKLFWCGSVLLVVVGFALTVAFAAALSGLCPYVLEVGVFASQTIQAGYGGLVYYWRCQSKFSPTINRTRWLSVALPLAAFVVFGLLFIYANPDLLELFGKSVEAFFNTVREWILQFSPSAPEVLFWLAVLWVAVGLLRPMISRTLFEEMSNVASRVPDRAGAPSKAPLYAAFRNTLVTVTLLFALYLIFEFNTLWFRVFPEGFYYSGYAHEGAAWLTAALALATATLSLIFRGRVLQDPRLPDLRRLAWIWSLENLILAVAVFHRLYIYIEFNGMTKMRMVGLYGISAVVVGFVLVVWKIVHRRNFIWLVRRHLWTLALAVYLFALTPVDAIVTNYNVRRILSGDPAPCVQISVHPISSEGVLFLEPLLGSDNEVIREGIRAMLAGRQAEAEAMAVVREQQGWTVWQIADIAVLRILRDTDSNWTEFSEDFAQREEALCRFHDYAYQWY